MLQVTGEQSLALSPCDAVTSKLLSQELKNIKRDVAASTHSVARALVSQGPLTSVSA